VRGEAGTFRLKKPGNRKGGKFMLFVAVAELKKGMVLGRSVTGGDCEILLPANTKLKPAHIEKINGLGLSGVYTLNEAYDEIVPEPIVPEELYLDAVRAAKDHMAEARGAGAGGGGIDAVTPVIAVLSEKKRRLLDYIYQKPYGEYEYYHAASGMILSLLLGMEMGIGGRKLYELGTAALLHDIGSVFLPPEILNRPGALTEEEFETVKRHTQKGFDFLRGRFGLSEEAALGALQHHENYDGTGYPSGLKRGQISLVGRIIAVTDVYDALVSRRPFRAAMYAKQGLEVLESRSDRKFDPDIVEKFAGAVAPYPSGVTVRLTNGETAAVFRNSREFPGRPRLISTNGKGEYIDLAKDPKWAKVKISRVLE
jgi:HD-GYP domain-containing protein (c-di-GMP phosphodiesterase class II)